MTSSNGLVSAGYATINGLDVMMVIATPVYHRLHNLACFGYLFFAAPCMIRGMTLDDLQALIEKMYSAKDRARGSPATFLWLSEEVGELAAALREGSYDEKCAEFADVLAWLVTLANINDVNLTKALRAKYGDGCPGCGKLVCTCDSKP